MEIGREEALHARYNQGYRQPFSGLMSPESLDRHPSDSRIRSERHATNAQ
jgi:hypothetical protein